MTFPMFSINSVWYRKSILRENGSPTMLQGNLRAAVLFVTLATVGAACSTSTGGTSGGACVPPKSPVITLAAYSTPREVYGKIIPAFQAKWKDEHNGQNVIFQESYGGSTSQAQNVANGF